MLHELDDVTSVWLQDPIRNWRDWPATAAAAAAQDKALASAGDVDAGGLLTKVNEDKLARDVDDLSAIFDELADGVVDFPLPCDEDDEDDAGVFAVAAAEAAVSSDAAADADAASDEELATGAVGEWLDKLDSDDALNVDEISEAFDALVAEQEELLRVPAAESSASECDDGSDDDVEMDESDAESEEEDDAASARALSVKVVPAAPVWATMAPLDPRSCIRTAVFKNLDSRIPRIELPRIDLSFAADKSEGASAPRACGPFAGAAAGGSMSPVRGSAKTAEAPAYRHDPATCWICKSSKTPEKKRALHRFLEKRGRRNWKKGPRYSGRSSVAASRVRNGGRFICTTQWI